MKNLDRLLNLVVAFLGSAVLVSILVMAVVAVRTSALNREAAAYVEANLPRIVGEWNPAELERRIVPEMLSPRVKEGLPPLFQSLSALGRLSSMSKPTGRTGSGAFPGTSINGTWADFAVAAEFERGRVSIELVLKRVADGWQIASFSVRPVAASAASPAAGEGEETQKDR